MTKRVLQRVPKPTANKPLVEQESAPKKRSSYYLARKAERQKQARIRREFEEAENYALDQIERLVGENYDWSEFNDWAWKSFEWRDTAGTPADDDDVTWQRILKALRVFLRRDLSPWFEKAA